jgi:hypothetical protein
MSARPSGFGFEAGLVVGVEDAAKQGDEGLLFVLGECLKELRLGAECDVVEAPELGSARWSQGYMLAAAVLGVAFALDESALIDVVEVADEVAAVDGEPVGEFVLRERPEVGQRGEDGEVWQSEFLCRECFDQQAVAYTCRGAGEVRRQAEQGGWAELVVHALSVS